MFNKKMISIICAAIVSVTALGGCASSKEPGSADTTDKETVSGEQTTKSSDTSQRVSLPYTEQAQETYKLPVSLELEEMPQRVVVMTMGPAELLHELGVEMLAIPDLSDKDAEWVKESGAQLLPLTAKTVDTESIIALEPDLIIMSAGKKEAYGNFFEEHKIPVYYTVSSSMDSAALEEVKEQISLYGKGFNRLEEMEKLQDRVAELEADITAWKTENSALQGQKMMILLDAPFTYANNQSTTLGSMLAALGLENMTDSIENLESVMGTGTMEISTEVIVEQNPPMIIAQPTGAGAGVTISTEDYKATVEAELNKDPQLWQAVDAVSAGNILYLGTDNYPGTSGLGIFQSYEYLMQELPAMATK